jgi:Domain of unknown function (DUF4365)
MRCIGRTRNISRCKRQASRWLFCFQHRFQPFALVVSFLGAIALIGGIYQDVVRPLLPESSRSSNASNSTAGSQSEPGLPSDEALSNQNAADPGIKTMKVSQAQLTESIGMALARAAFSKLGFVFREQPVLDYGIDAHAEIVEGGAATGQLLALQIKAGQSYFQEEAASGFVFRSDDQHVTYWLNHALPVLLLLCDTNTERIYWQAIMRETVVATGAGWKLVVPKTQIINRQARERLKDLATPIVPESRYTILSTKDNSVAIAKRYSLEILINGKATKPEIASVIRQVTRDHIDSKYYRDEIVESHWKNSSANVIWTFVFLSLDDRKDVNWVARSLWIDPNLPEDRSPGRIDGEHIGDSIVVDWSERYSESAKIFASNTLNKASYLKSVRGLLPELERAVEAAAVFLGLQDSSGHSGGGRVLPAELVGRIDTVYKEISNLGLPPVECRDVDLRVQSSSAAAHNIILPYLELGKRLGEQDPTAMQRASYGDFKKEFQRLKFELEKVR